MARHFRSSRMTKQWDLLTENSVALVAAGTTLISIASVGIAQTVLRLRGELLITPTVNPVGGDACVITAGIGIVSSDAALLGSTAMPDPAGDQSYPWLWWGSWSFFSETATAGDFLSNSIAHRQTIDSKAMRKVTAGQSIVAVVEYEDVSGTPPYTVLLANTRILVAS